MTLENRVDPLPFDEVTESARYVADIALTGSECITGRDLRLMAVDRAEFWLAPTYLAMTVDTERTVCDAYMGLRVPRGQRFVIGDIVFWSRACVVVDRIGDFREADRPATKE